MQRTKPSLPKTEVPLFDLTPVTTVVRKGDGTMGARKHRYAPRARKSWDEATRQRISAKMKQYVRTEEHQARITEGLKGIVRSEETRQRMSAAKQRERHPRWRGGKEAYLERAREQRLEAAMVRAITGEKLPTKVRKKKYPTPKYVRTKHVETLGLTFGLLDDIVIG